MKKAKRLLGLLLSVLMVASVVPAGLLQVSAANIRTDFTVDFDCPYTDPEEAILDKSNYFSKTVSSSRDGAVRWKHISSDSREDFTKALESDSASEKYITLDTDVSWTYGYSSWDPITVTSDKVLDLNGKTVYFLDKRNKVDRHGKWEKDEYFQSDDAQGFRSYMFSIESGATLTIIDSSQTAGSEGTGKIYINAYMIDPYKYPIKRFTSRDLFHVADGNLVIYGGTFQAGRSKQQSDDDIYKKIKTVVGSAVTLATDIAGYATPINSATGKLKDITFDAQKAIKELEGKNGDNDDSTGTQSTPPGTTTGTGGTMKLDGANGDPAQETKKDNPTEEPENSVGRNQTVEEKKTEKKDSKDNKANKDGTAKATDTNSKIAEAQNAVVNAATNKDTLTKMVDSAFSFGEAIANCFKTNFGSIVTQSFLGTCVSIGNAGTFVSYGGKFIGYGMTANTRDAVIECTEAIRDSNGKQTGGGKAYIYGGLFEGRCGANIFNIVRAKEGSQTFTQYTTDDSGNRVTKQVTVPFEETNGLQVLSLAPDSTESNIKFVDTGNIRIRGGTFRNQYELHMLGLNEDDPEKPANNHASETITTFPGTAGSVNLGISSYGNDLIRDGRIQIVDNYGDGALVLMDENRGPNDKVNHYRLYCAEDELRYKSYLTVYPNESLSNSTYSFSLATRYNNADTGRDMSEIWAENADNKRAAYSSDEQFFRFEIDSDATEKYYVVPQLSQTDVYGEHLDESEVWYYNTPTDANNRKIGIFSLGSNEATGISKGKTYTITYTQKDNRDSVYNKIDSYFEPGSVSYRYVSQDYLRNLKWFTYKIYRVDPLTRENLTDVYGYDQPVATAVYGCSTEDALRIRLPLDRLGINYQPGEMYRIVLSVDEYLQYSEPDSGVTKLPTAKCESSILFLCYSQDELTDKGGATLEADYTPLQWIVKPEAGKTAQVQLVNAKAGQIDWQTRKIFELYYQWYAVDPVTGKETMIAGTDHIYDDTSLKNYEYHKYANFKPGKDGYTYLDTTPLPADTKEWTNERLHSYLQATTPNERLKKYKNQNLHLANNNIFYSNTDSCYIPEEYEGYEIYCKAIAVNNFWPLNFDHRQTFSTHKEIVPRYIATFDPKVQLTYASADELVTKDKPVKIDLSINPKSLNKDERYSIRYTVKSANRSYSKNVSFEKATAEGKLPTVLFPNDFTNPDNVASAIYDVIVDVIKYKNDTWVSTSTLKKQSFSYKTELESIEVSYPKSYFYNNAFHIDWQYVADNFKVTPSPKGAAQAYLFVKDVNFTTTNEQVATLNEKGKLILGGHPGTTVLKIKNPDDTWQSYNIVVPIKNVSVSGIDAPVLGAKADRTAVVNGEGYRIKQVRWYDGTAKKDLGVNETIQPFRIYTVYVDVQPESGNEFDSSNFSEGYRTWVDTEFTVQTLDGSSQTIKDYTVGSEYNELLDTVTLKYTYAPLVDDNISEIDTIVLNFPTVVNHGDSVADWLEQVEFYCAAGDAAKTEYYPTTPASGGSFITDAYGYGYSSSDTGLFLYGCQDGIYARMQLPEGATAAETVKVIVNGDDGYVANKSSLGLTVSLHGALTVLPSDVEIKPRPVFDIKQMNLNVEEYKNTDDYISSPMNVFSEGDENKRYYVSEWNFWELNENGVFHSKYSGHTNSGSIQVSTKYRAAGEGTGYMPVYADVPFRIYNGTYTESVQKLSFPVTVLDPDGKQISTFSVPCESDDYQKYFSLPELDGLFVAPKSENINYSAGAPYVCTYNVTQPVTVRTVSADNLRIQAGATQANVTFIGTNNIIYSLDGNCWTTCTTFNDLQPDTDYTLYYKQGRFGDVYTKAFSTTNQQYLNLGKTYVTDENTGNLETDHWHYEPSTKTLTLKNASLELGSVEAASDDLLGLEISYNAGIFCPDELHIELLGSNTIQLTDGGLTTAGIFTAGDLTIGGSGDLTIDMYRANGFVDYAIQTPADCTLSGTGTLRYTPAKDEYNYLGHVGIQAQDLTVTDRTVLLAINENNTNDGTKAVDLTGNISISSTKSHSSTIFTNAAHSATTNAAGLSGTKHAEITFSHTCTVQKAAEEYYFGGDCVSGAKYYRSCACGYTDRSESNTFTAAKGSHSTVSFAGQPATCTEDGFKAYEKCTRCGYSTFEVIPAPGHSFYTHKGKQATCFEEGYEEYYLCEYCDFNTKVIIPKTAHEIINHSAKAADCTSGGWDAYESCANCDYETTHKTYPALGHSFGAGAVTKPATCTDEGREEFTCSRCGSIEAKTLAKLSHNWSLQQTVPATCAAEGSKTYVCTACTATKSETLAKLSTHTYKTTTTKATLSKAGSKVTKCTVCGNVSEKKTIAYPKTITLSSTKAVYTGKAIKPTVTVKDSKGKTISSSNYTVSYKNNTSVGTATVTVTFKGNYTGTKALTFTIAPKQVTGLKASTVKTTSIKLTWTKVTGAKVYKVERSTDGKKWTVLTSAATTNSYTASKLTAGKKYQFRVTAYDSTKKIAGAASAVLETGTLTASPTVTLKSSKAKTATASWKKVTGASKYTVYKSTDGKKWTKVTTTTELTYTLKKLTGGKKIYVKVTAINAYGKASADSAVKSVKVKK